MEGTKTVLITGCSTGIGKALAELFHQKGHRVIATSRDKAKIGFLEKTGIRTHSLDVTKPESISALCSFIKTEIGELDILINNAGYGQIGPAVELPDEVWFKQFQTNLFGPAALVRKLAPLMIARRSGSIVNIGSISGITPTPFSAAYCAAKSAMHSYSDVLRMELKPFGINVITVQPGAIKSNFGNAADASIREALPPDSLYQSLQKQIHYRAEISQIGAYPVEKFVQNIYRQLMKKNPPAVICTGKKSFFLPFMKRWIPEKTLDKILSKSFGLNLLKKGS